MAVPIPEGPSLRRLFVTLTERNFIEKLGWGDLKVTTYISTLLTDFAHVDNLYRIKNCMGKKIEEVVEMLTDGDVSCNAPSFGRGREVHKHIGDYTLFMVGIFPEHLKRLKKSGLTSADVLIDYVQTGKRSYYVVSEFTYGAYKDAAPLFRKLSDNFELCILGLNYVRLDLEK